MNSLIAKFANYPLVLRGCSWAAGAGLGYLLTKFPAVVSILAYGGVTADSTWTAAASVTIGTFLAHIVSKALHIADSPNNGI